MSRFGVLQKAHGSWSTISVEVATEEGTDDAAAALVVDEIKQMGGDAVANFDSVTDPDGTDRMVAAAIDTWGRLDAVVNNAGILRDITFKKMDDPK